MLRTANGIEILGSRYLKLTSYMLEYSNLFCLCAHLNLARNFHFPGVVNRGIASDIRILLRRFCYAFTRELRQFKMDAALSVPTPKTPRKSTTRDERLRCETLYFEANWTQAQIVLQLNLTLAQVKYALAHRVTPQKKHSGRKVFLNTPQRKRLINWVTTSRDTRRTQ